MNNILILVLCGFLYLFGENKSLESVWLANHENMVKRKKKEKELIALRI